MKEEKINPRKKTTFTDVISILFIFFALAVAFHPAAKGLAIQGLMKIGLFQPEIKKQGTPKDVRKLTAGISFKDAANNTVNLSELNGKVVFINFWATWCPPCRAEMPSIETLYQKLKDNENIVFLMVDVDNDYHKAKKYMDEMGFSLPVYTPASEIPKELMSGTIPTTLILNKNGQLVFSHEGAGNFGGKKMMDFLTGLSS